MSVFDVANAFQQNWKQLIFIACLSRQYFVNCTFQNYAEDCSRDHRTSGNGFFSLNPLLQLFAPLVMDLSRGGDWYIYKFIVFLHRKLNNT